MLAQLEDVLWAAKPPEELLATHIALERLRSRTAGLQGRVAVEIDAAQAPRSQGWASTADYLTASAGGRRGSGRRLLRLGAALTGAQAATAAALRAGDISPEHADVIVRALESMPVDRPLREAAERLLLHEARGRDATELERVARHVLERLDPEGAAKRDERALDKLERSAHLNRGLAIVDDGIGGVRLRGRGTVEDAAVIKQVLFSLNAPLPATDPDCGEDSRDPRDHGARTWDALVEACSRLTDAETLPDCHGAKPRITLTLDFTALLAGLGEATLETGEQLSAAAVRRLACDADLIPAVLGTDGEVLDVGRTQRLVTAAIWRALVLRDAHCRFPGCRRVPVACDAHHVVHWADGGGTDLANLVLLCRAHHRVIHTTGWEVRISPRDRRPEFRPPPGRHRTSERLGSGLAPDADGWGRERHPRDDS